METLEQEWMKTIGEAIKNLQSDNVIVQAPGATTYVGGQHVHLQQNASPEETDFEEEPPSDNLSDEDETIVRELTDVFYSDSKEAANFLASIRRMTKPTEITQLVTRLVEEGKISDLSCHRPLWSILHEHGIYTKSETNWDAQVKPVLRAKK